MLRLAHPATGAEALFLLTPGHELLELNFVKNEHTSWFVGDAVAEGLSRGLVRLPPFHQPARRRRPVHCHGG